MVGQEMQHHLVERIQCNEQARKVGWPKCDVRPSMTQILLFVVYIHTRDSRILKYFANLYNNIIIKNTRFMRRLRCYWTLEEKMWRTWVKIQLLSGIGVSEMIELPLSTGWHIPKCYHEAFAEFEETRSFLSLLSFSVIFFALTQQQIWTKLKQGGSVISFKHGASQNSQITPSFAWSTQICTMYPTQKKHGISPINQ